MKKHSNRESSLFGGLLLVAIASAACDVEPQLELEDAELLAATSTHKAQVKRRVLTVTGTSASSRLALRLGPTGLLEVDVGDDGTAEFRFDRSTFESIVIDAAAGDDVVRMDESAGVFTTEERVTIKGGDGNDTLLGGIGAETFYGGRGDDTIDGGRDADVVFMGEGNDSFRWDPGDGSDLIEGEAGRDVVVFNGAAVNETFTVSDDQGRVRFTRDVAAIALDLDGVERLELHPLRGGDTVVVHDLAATALERIDVDLAALAGDSAGDAAADVVAYEGTPGVDTLDVARAGDAVVATGLGVEVAIVHGEPALDRLVMGGAGGDVVNVNGSADADSMSVVAEGTAPVVSVAGWNVLVAAPATGRLAVNGLGGDDSIVAGNAVQLPLQLDGGAGNDTIVGGGVADLILGGDGNDLLDGNFGADTIRMGAGDDVVVWDPGKSSDVIEGEAGDDTLAFNAANIGEQLDLAANGGRVRLTRDVAAVTLDLDGVERVALRVLGGADRIAVHELSGTALADVTVDLASSTGGSDAQADSIIVDAAATQRAEVAAVGAATVVTGLAARVAVTNGDPFLDRLIVNPQGGARVAVNGSPDADTLFVVDDAGTPAVQAFSVMVEAVGGAMTVNGLGGDDTLRAASAVLVPLWLDGGDGNDFVAGGSGADLLLGGDGNDTIDGGFGADVIDLGPGDDLFVWDPGKSSDVVDGADGQDMMLFNASNAGETLDLAASGDRLRLLRNIGLVTLDVGGVERVDLRTLGGADTITLNDLGGTAVTQVNLDLAASVGGGDAQLDSVIVNGSAGADTITVAENGLTVGVTGLAAALRIVGQDVTDQLSVFGRGGVDTFVAPPGLESMNLFLSQD